MNKNIKNRIYAVFKKGNGYAYTKDITGAGIHNIYLNTLLEDGQIERIKRGLYRWIGMSEDNNSSMIDACMAIPKGVICLQSALAYYNLTTYKPWEISVAIDRKAKVTLPNYPPISLCYFTTKMYKSGIEYIKANGHSIKIYSKEKTICDCVRYRDKVGKDIVKEAIIDYLKSSARNLDALMNYAQICGVAEQIQIYLEVLL